MASNQSGQPSKARGGLSLYANLLNPDAAASSAGTISRAPVVFSQGAAKDPQQDDTATAQKQLNAGRETLPPIPQPSQKGKPKPGFTKLPSSNADIPSSDPATKPAAQAPAFKSTLADWAGDDDDINDYYAPEKRQRGGRRKRRKDKEERVVIQNWDDIYDPSRPNVYEDYKGSEEKYREIREWKDRLYAHRQTKRKLSSDYSDDSDLDRPRMSNNFAPPAAYSFAPPSFADEEKEVPTTAPVRPRSPPRPPVEVPDDATGEDAYARRMRLSQGTSAASPQPPPAPPAPPSPQKATLPTLPLPGSISRAPVRYQLPTAPAELPATEAELEEALAKEPQQQPEPEPEAADSDAPRSTRPGQKGFAERLLSKYGWTKGSGLGASGSGIVNPLRVQVEKRKKKSDAEGGGFVGGAAAKGRIIGAKQKPAAPEEEGPFGAMSEVIILRGMVDGLDLDAEMGEGGLMQEIGEECAEKYGRVERVFINRHHSDPTTSIPVFVKFTSQLSALRAVNALEGRVFNGNAINARFFNAEAFEAGVYE